MRKLTLERLLNSVDDRELLDIYTELTAGKVPATSYCHDFCRKVNRMIDEGELCINCDSGYRHIYLPSLSKAVYKEMAARYAFFLENYRAPTQPVVSDGQPDEDEGPCVCTWCNGVYDEGDLLPTDLGMICESCVAAIRSRGEDIAVYSRY